MQIFVKSIAFGIYEIVKNLYLSNISATTREIQDIKLKFGSWART